MIRQLGSLAFMGDMPLDQIVAHFIAWGQSNYDYTSRLEAAFLEVKAGALFCDSRCRFRTSHEHCDYDGGLCEPYSLHLIERCPMKAEWEEQAREALERIRNGE